MNKIIKINLKTKLDEFKDLWASELPKVLWAYHTIIKNSTRETPLPIDFGTKVVILVETVVPSYHAQIYKECDNEE